MLQLLRVRDGWSVLKEAICSGQALSRSLVRTHGSRSSANSTASMETGPLAPSKSQIRERGEGCSEVSTEAVKAPKRICWVGLEQNQDLRGPTRVRSQLLQVLWNKILGIFPQPELVARQVLCPYRGSNRHLPGQQVNNLRTFPFEESLILIDSWCVFNDPRT